LKQLGGCPCYVTSQNGDEGRGFPTKKVWHACWLNFKKKEPNSEKAPANRCGSLGRNSWHFPRDSTEKYQGLFTILMAWKDGRGNYKWKRGSLGGNPLGGHKKSIPGETENWSTLGPGKLFRGLGGAGSDRVVGGRPTGGGGEKSNC